jgi:hypothetical protein
VSKPLLRKCATHRSKAEFEALGGVLPDNVSVVGDEAVKEIEYIACVPANWPAHPAMFLTNEAGRCCECDRAIVFRPDIPKGKHKICVPCVAAKTGDPEFVALVKRREGRP